MTKIFSISICLILLTSIAHGQNPETLQSVTTRGNITIHSIKTNLGTNSGGMDHFGLLTGGLSRWKIGLINVDGPGNVGSDFSIWRYANDSSYLGLAFQISRSNGLVTTTGRMRINSSPDDGVTPLQINGGIKTSGASYRAFTANITGGYATIDINENNSRRVFIGYNSGTLSNNCATFGVVDDNGVERGIFVNRFSGNVGIGTIPNAPAKLAVNGDIYAKRIKVTQAAADWPDYVFNENYQLPSLQKIEKYIIEHKHLPGIPSAEEVQRTGVDLGEINKNLLQKIEELTLHLINQQKEIEALKDWKKKVEMK